MEKPVDKSKFINSFTCVALVFSLLHLCVVQFENLNITTTILCYALGVFFSIVLTVYFRIKLSKCDDYSFEHLYVLFVMLLTSPYFIFAVAVVRTTFRPFIVYMLYFLLLIVMRSKKVLYLVPIIIVAMTITAHSPALQLLFASLPIFYYEYKKAEENRTIFSVILAVDVVSLLVIVIIEMFFSNKTDIWYIYSSTTNIMYTRYRNRVYLFDKLIKSVAVIIPLSAFFVVSWKNILKNEKTFLLSNFTGINIAVSIAFVIFLSDYTYILCIVQILMMIYLISDKNEGVIDGFGEALCSFKKHPTLTLIMSIWYFCFGFYQLNSSTGNVITNAINKFISVNS